VSFYAKWNDVAGRRYAFLCEEKRCQIGVIVYSVMVYQYFGAYDADIAPSELVSPRIDSSEFESYRSAQKRAPTDK
jgi:hypothetical protein